MPSPGRLTNKEAVTQLHQIIVRSHSLSNQPLNHPLTKDIVVYSVICIAVVFFILTIRHGHNWGGDFALYISHAINISEGHPYSETDFVYNPRDPYLSPRSYPPVYPLLLAPVYRLFGLDLYAMKIAGILTFAVFLLLFYRYARNRLDSPVAQVLVVTAVAFSPWFWEAKDQILPDYTFLLLLYGSIILLDKLSSADRGGRMQFLVMVCAGLTVCLAYGTRSLGLLIIPALVFHDVIRRRMISRTTLAITVLFALYYFAQNGLLQIDQSYYDGLKVVESNEQGTVIDLRETGSGDEFSGQGLFAVITSNLKILHNRIPENLYIYGQKMSEYWYIGDSNIPRKVLLPMMSFLAVAGFLVLIINKPSFGDYLVVTYVVVLLVVPFVQQRYLLPLVPLFLIYIFQGTEKIRQFASNRCHGLRCGLIHLFPLAVTAIIAASYASSYSLSSASAIEQGVKSNESIELFNFIRENTTEDSLLVFHKPRPLALFTGRRATKYHWELDMDKLWLEIADMGATHIILPKYIDPAAHQEYFFPAIVERYRQNLDILFENRDYIVYHIDDVPDDDGPKQQ